MPTELEEAREELARLRGVIDECMATISLATYWCCSGDREALVGWVERVVERAYPSIPPITDPDFWKHGHSTYTFESREPKTFTLFLGRGPANHGLNLCCLNDFDHMGAQTRMAILTGLNQLRYTATLEEVMKLALPALPTELASRFRQALDLKPPPPEKEYA